MTNNVSKKPRIIGCIHTLPLPGAAGYSGNISEIVDIAVKEAIIYVQSGFDAIILENMHDTPYLNGHVYPETIAAMTAIACAVRKALPDFPLGIQILAGANREALSVAIAAKLNFLRVEGFCFAHIADEGLISSSAAELIRLRDYLKAKDIKIFADIKKKHSAHAITSDVSIEETAEAAQFMRADGLIVTGTATGKSPDFEELKSVKAVSQVPVYLGSGINPQNISDYAKITDGIIIGSFCKEGGYWENTVSEKRCKEFMEAVDDLN